MYRITTILNILLISLPVFSKPPSSFTFLNHVDPSIIENSRYATSDNFYGQIVPGYHSKHIMTTKKAAIQLKKANQYFHHKGYSLVVYDGYRPKRAVHAFHLWIENNQYQTQLFYFPTLKKSQLKKYIKNHHSAHSRGSTVDVSLIETSKTIKPINAQPRTISNGDIIYFLDDNTLDMGSSFDLFHPISHPYSLLLPTKYKKNRQLLIQGMQKFGFKVSPDEWWHFQLKNEPYAENYFDFMVK